MYNEHDVNQVKNMQKKIKKKIIPYTTIINRSDTITHQIAKLM